MKLGTLCKHEAITAVCIQSTVLVQVPPCSLEYNLATFTRKLFPPSSEQKNERHECARFQRHVVVVVPDHTSSHPTRQYRVLSLDLAHRLIFNKVLPLPSGKEST